MNISALFDRLWEQYSSENPSVKKIHQIFTDEGEPIVNDHIALRTFNDPRIGIDILSKPFVENGYREAGKYQFPEKKLAAKHFEMKGFPRVFISELLLEEFSSDLKSSIKSLINKIPENVRNSEDFVAAGNVFGTPLYESYEKLRVESEYAAWVYAFGFRANHFTVDVNSLSKYNTLEKLNEFLKEKGFQLNDSGGEIKGSPGVLLEQSSTLADRVPLAFAEGSFEIPSCYYEFAKRYPDKEGKLFSGFIAKSADKIFESTDAE